MQQAVYPGGGTSGRKAARQGKAAHAVQGHHQIVGEGEGIDFQLVDHEGGIRIAGRKIIAHPDEGLKALDELIVRDDSPLAPRKPGQLAIGYRPAEQIEKRVSVRHFRQCGHDGLPLAETFGVKLGVRPAQTGADHHAELAGTAQPHDQLIAESRRVRRHELHQEHAPQVSRHGVPQRGAFQPPVRRRRGVLIARDPLGVAFGHFGQHASDGGAYSVRRFRHNAHAAHLGLVDDGRRHDLEHRHLSRQGHEFFLRRADVSGQKQTPGRRFRSGKGQQAVHLVFVQKVPPFLPGIAEKFRYGLVFYGQIHGASL